MKVKIIPIMIGAFGTVTKGLLKALDDLEVGGRVETIQTTEWLKTARILRRANVGYENRPDSWLFGLLIVFTVCQTILGYVMLNSVFLSNYLVCIPIW